MSTINQQMSNILDTAKSIGDFKMLMRVVEAAGLEDTLKTRGPFTVFAPTDEAFRNLPTGQLDEWLRDPAKLNSIVTYHVVDRKVTESEFHRLTADRRTPSVITLQGTSVMLKTQGSLSKTMFVNDAKVIKADIETSNGVIHIIDRVLEPAPIAQVQMSPTQPTKNETSQQETANSGQSTTPAPQTTVRNESTTTTTTTTNPSNPTS
jgi:uncharacterized surface protein with fasciclin (FAS1) repeats